MSEPDLYSLMTLAVAASKHDAKIPDPIASFIISTPLDTNLACCIARWCRWVPTSQCYWGRRRSEDSAWHVLASHKQHLESLVIRYAKRRIVGQPTKQQLRRQFDAAMALDAELRRRKTRGWLRVKIDKGQGMIDRTQNWVLLVCKDGKNKNKTKHCWVFI